MTEILRIDSNKPDRHVLERAAACLRSGGLVAFPTETVYGLGAHALDRAAVRRLFEAKGRPPNDPVIVHVAQFDDVAVLTNEMPAPTRALAERFWPGPLTLVLPRSARVPAEVSAGLETIAVRVPSHPVARALLAAAAIPIAAPSANLFSRPSPTRASHVIDDLRDRIDLVLDGGQTPIGVESTVLDLTTDPPRILRPGGTAIDAIRQVLPTVAAPAPPTAAPGEAMRAPGLLAQHYAPRTPLTLYRGSADAIARALRVDAEAALAAGRRVGLLATRDQAAALRGTGVVVGDLGPHDDAREVATRLYAALRELDAANLDVILAHDFAGETDLWPALRDRLRRASVRILDAT